MSDNYEFHKTNEARDATDYSPYVDKQYKNDMKNGVYTINIFTLVNFDLGQIYDSKNFTETSELFAVLSIAIVASFSNGTGLVAPTERSQALCTIKSNFLNL
jgi:hypothetical protein